MNHAHVQGHVHAQILMSLLNSRMTVCGKRGLPRFDLIPKLLLYLTLYMYLIEVFSFWRFV